MNFFISDAMAEGGQASPDGGLLQLVMMIGIFFAIMYFMIIRPQSKKAKEHQALLDDLRKGNEVTTASGILGKVKKIDDNFVQIEVAEGTIITVQRHAIGNIMPKGTIKTL
ncbi:MAG: preprotein translocase subunit YajC [Cocleimonas sp.]|nr:preprotein translocase subunit YajC [Cocleimonas sp.]